MFSLRSSDQFKPDESGISSEEGCLPGPAFSKLANLATLIEELETTVETHLTACNSSSRPEEESVTDNEVDCSNGLPPAAQAPVVLGPPGTQPQPGKTLARYDQCPSVVYSRSSSQLVSCGAVPNTTLAALKHSRVSRRAEVMVPVPSDGERRWTRAGARAITSAHHPGVSYWEESDTSYSESSSSDPENDVYMASVERKKKVRRRRQLLTGSHRDSTKDSKRVVSMAPLLVGEGDVEREDWDGGVQMECEVGEDVETQSPFFNFPSPQALPDPPVGRTNPSPPRVFTVYDDLLFQPHHRPVWNSQTPMDGGLVSSRWRGKPHPSIRPCAVNITNLPRHIVSQHLHSVQADGQKFSVVLAGRHRRDSASSEESTSSSSSSASLSMLRQETSCVGSSKSGQTDSKNPSSPVPSTSVLKLTPRRERLGSGRTPMARRSFPFSKPPSTPRTVSPMIKRNKRPGFRAVPVDWSPDEDFENDPAPSVIMSPLVQRGTGVSVKREKSEGSSPSKEPPGSEGGIVRDTTSPCNQSPAKNTAQSVTETGNNANNGTQCLAVYRGMLPLLVN